MDLPILKRLNELRPNHVLDVGCGCGGFTASLSAYCKTIEAVDPLAGLVERCRTEQQRPNINYRVMDALNLHYPDRAFDVVLERGSLHHIAEWRKALAEMIRVTRQHILIEERVNDPRSTGKANGIKGQNLFLELQEEVKYPHFPYIAPELIVEALQASGFQVQWQVIPNEQAVSFDEFFHGFEHFANASERPSYWMARMEELRKEIGPSEIIESDTVYFEATKEAHNASGTPVR